MSTLAWPLLAVRLYEVRDMERTVAIVTAVTSPTCRLTICTAMSASGGVQNGKSFAMGPAMGSRALGETSQVALVRA